MLKYRCPFLALLCLVIPVLPVAGQEAKPVVAVLPFQAVEAPAAVAHSAAAFLEAALVKTGLLTVVSQTERDRILQAQEASLAECADTACAIRIGRLLSAAQVVAGEVVGLGRKFIVNAKIIDVATGEILAADTSSAAGEPGLERVCRALTRSLLDLAELDEEPGRPEAGGEAVQEPEAGGAEEQAAQEAAAGESAAGEASSEAESGAAEQPRARQSRRERRPRREKPERSTARRPPPTRNAVAARLATTGAIAMQAASIASAVSFELLQTSEQAYQSYLAAAADVGDFYSAYAWAYAGQLTLGLGADFLWAGGATAVAAAAFRYPEEAYVLSGAGKALFAASWSLVLAGNVLGLVAGNQYYVNEQLYQDYLAASADVEAYREDYESGHASYLTSRILSYSFWGLGAAGLVCAPLLPGNRAPILSGRLDRWLLAGGTALAAAGSVFQSMALNTRELAQDRYAEYLAASAGAADFYDSYRRAHTQHVVYSALAYSLWAGGGAAVLGALFFNPGRGKPEKEPPTALLLVPAPGGFTIRVWIDPRGMWL